jgi:hypothetical protein
MPHWWRFERQIAALVCSFALLSAGANIDINRAIMAITTKSSINVNPLRLFIVIIRLSLVLEAVCLCSGPASRQTAVCLPEEFKNAPSMQV